MRLEVLRKSFHGSGELLLKEADPFLDQENKEDLKKYINCAAGILRYYKISLPEEIPNCAVLQENLRFTWKETVTCYNPHQTHIPVPETCSHHNLEVTETQTAWQIETGNLICRCLDCKSQGPTTLWAHPWHRVKGSRDYCNFCSKDPCNCAYHTSFKE